MKISKLLILALSTLHCAQSEIVVNTTTGQVRGIMVQLPLLFPYIAFKGIPYAEPPVGELRFRNPVPHRGWSGIRDATKHGSKCPTNGIMGLSAGGNEDCLFLNVYTTDVLAKRPVMFWIHGGGFLFGNGDTVFYGPSRLVNQNIVVVSINYRLGALGFLSTGDKHAQGNYGLKDAVVALKWVKRNIRNFGGDPKKVTIAGESAGGVAVQHLIMAEMSRGLFRYAIVMSGSVFSPYSFQANPRPKAEQLAKALGKTFNSTKDLMRKLRSVPFFDILRVERDVTHQDFLTTYRSFDYGLVVEPNDAEEERFLTDTPENIMQRDYFRTVPSMVGTMSMEGLITLLVFSTPIIYDNFEKLNNNPALFVPENFNISSSDTDTINEVGWALKEAYFKGKKVSSKTETEIAEFITDGVYKFAVDRVVKLMANMSNDPIYYYEITYDGTLNLMKFLLFKKLLPGACHADELFYLFDPENIAMTAIKFAMPPNHPAFMVKDRVVKMWSNFVKFGKPTPGTDDLVRVRWPRYTTENEEYFEIGYNLKVRRRFERLKIWYELLEKYTGHR